MADLIEVRGLEKSYGDFLLRDIDLAVAQGEVVGLVGENGAGKTTAIKCMLGLAMPDAGTVRLFGTQVFDGRDAGSFDERAMLDARRRLGVVFDSLPFPRDMMVRDVRSLGASAYETWDDGRFDGLLSEFDLTGKKRAGELSRGMGMKLQLAFALAHDPDLLVLDEATAGLDPIAREEVLEMLRAFVADERRGILFSSHITSDLEKIADRVVCIDGGRELFDLPKDDICDMAGIAALRAVQLDDVRAWVHEQEGAGRMRMMRTAYATELLVPDRLAFSRAFPDYEVRRADIDEYLLFTMKGETL